MEATYKPLTTVIASSQTRGTAKLPILLAESVFQPGAKVVLSTPDRKIPVNSLKKQILESWSIQTEGLQNKAETKITYRYLAPKANGTIHIWSYRNSRWSEIGYRTDGQYLVFETAPQAVIAVTVTTRNYIPIIASAAILGTIIIVFLFFRKKNRFRWGNRHIRSLILRLLRKTR